MNTDSFSSVWSVEDIRDLDLAERVGFKFRLEMGNEFRTGRRLETKQD